MGPTTLPARPVEDWERVRDEWVLEVERVVGEVEAWAHAQGWGTLRESKRIVEDRLGPYEVPRLLVHATIGRLLLDPAARFVPGAEGLFDFFAIPSYDGLILARFGGRWFLMHENDSEGPRSPWSEAVFVEAARRLTDAQCGMGVPR